MTSRTTLLTTYMPPQIDAAAIPEIRPLSWFLGMVASHTLI
jgi:hypothetical protein